MPCRSAGGPFRADDAAEVKQPSNGKPTTTSRRSSTSSSAGSRRRTGLGARARVRALRLHLRGHQQPRLRAHVPGGARPRAAAADSAHWSASLRAMAHAHADDAMMSRTHGQPATPTTLGKEIAVFAHRLRQQRDGFARRADPRQVQRRGGQLQCACQRLPRLDWPGIGKRFVESLGLVAQRLHDADRAARLDGGVLSTRSRDQQRAASTCAAISGGMCRSAISDRRSSRARSAPRRCRTRSTRSTSRMPKATSGWPMRCCASCRRSCRSRAGNAT